MNDTSHQMMMYDAQKKSLGVAYLLWFFLGSLGAHRFYAGKTGSAILQLMVWLVGWGTLIVGVGFVVLAIAGIWLLIDAFLLPGIIRTHNILLAGRIA